MGAGSRPGERRGGRKKGTPNRVTKDARALFAQFLDANAGRMQELWDRVANEDPAKALEILGKLGEFVIPKLARTEYTGPDGGAIPIASATAEITDEDAMKSYLRMLGSTRIRS